MKARPRSLTDAAGRVGVRCGLLLVLLGLSATVHAQSTVIPVWPGRPPGSEDWTHQEQVTKSQFDGFDWVRNVSTPTLTVYRPDPAVSNGTAVIVAPGGGFHFLSIETEGNQVAEWLAARGVTAFVLKYRVVPTPAAEDDFWKQIQLLFTGGEAVRAAMDRVTPLAVRDGREAVRLVRRRAAEWGLAPDRIGLLGFSAGGRVAAGVALEGDVESRPDFVAPIYGALWGDVTVPQDAPPLFTLVAQDDPLAATAVVDLYAAWKRAGVPAELHVYAKGGHGFGMKKQGLPIDTWIERFGDWLHAQGLLNPHP
jgi:acetyl esterase/lipase